MKKILVIASAMLFGFINIQAAGTAAGTPINNQATLSYDVGGVSQTAVDSNTDTFVVDKKIDFVVVHQDSVKHLSTVPGAQDVEREFTLTNEGNKVQDFTVDVSNLIASEVYDGKQDTANMNNLEISVNGGAWQAGSVTIANLGVDANITIKVRGDVASNATDQQVMNVQLEATAVQAGTTTAEVNTGDGTGADRQATEDTVLGEGAGVTNYGNTNFDGKYSAWGGYIIATPTLALTKLSCVLKDEITTDNTKAKRIPGATLVYVFDVNNASATTDATDVNLSDAFVNELDLGSSVGTVVVRKDISSNCKCDNGAAEGGNSGGSNVTTTNAVSGQNLTVKGIEITKGSHTCVSVEVKIK
jgi:hypothetical protein